MKNTKVLFFGPYPTPYTGQSISFKQVYNNFEGSKFLFNTTKFKTNKLLNSIYCIFYLPIVFFSNSFDKVYFTCSRSKLGFLKDFQLIFLSKIFNLKIINHLHGADFKDFYKNSSLLKKTISWCYNQIDTSIVLLPAMKDQFVDFNYKEIKVVENCYTTDLEGFDVDFSKKKQQVVYLSNLIYSKGIFVFLESIEKVLALRKNVVVKIAGAPMADDFMTTKEVDTKFKKKSNFLKQKYPYRYFYLGTVKGKKKVDLLSESSIFILPTFYKTEAFPLTIIEALYFGNIVITTNHNYLRDVISDDNGALVNIKATKDIIEKTLNYLDNKEVSEKIKMFNHVTAKKRYNPQIFIKKINRIITES